MSDFEAEGPWMITTPLSPSDALDLLTSLVRPEPAVHPALVRACAQVLDYDSREGNGLLYAAGADEAAESSLTRWAQQMPSGLRITQAGIVPLSFSADQCRVELLNVTAWNRRIITAAPTVVPVCVGALGVPVLRATINTYAGSIPKLGLRALHSALRDHLREQAHGPRVPATKLRMDWDLFTVEGDRTDRDIDRRIIALLDDPYPEGAGYREDVLSTLCAAFMECPDVNYRLFAELVTAAFSLAPDVSLDALYGVGTLQAVLGVGAVLDEAVAAGVVWLGSDQLRELESAADYAREHLGLGSPAATPA
ncbi:hypothetical protein [Tsukamurella spumae]|uniref:Uncharacterized protein n=1 Tax=Tsukamurella spumae TaxID=44753 RepID=A0A846X7K5_9ACTN|nr:hypothetical protein [Tsukamurella spumae]NKY19740.1 hypothetical protein [Tsukamurella spumae]